MISKNAQAAARYRERQKARKAGAPTPPEFAEWKRGPGFTLNPGLRVVQRLAKDLKTKVPQLARGALDPKRHANLVMLACKTCPESAAARRGFEIPAAEQPLYLRKKWHTFPPLHLKASNVVDGGAGVFARQKIKRNDYVCEYFGSVLHRNEALKLRDDEEDTHIRTLGRLEELGLDGRLTKFMPIEKYLVGHNVGSFLNGSAKGLRANCKFDLITDVKQSVVYPRADGGQGILSHTRCYVRALQDIEAGEELIVSYGRTYAVLHLQKD